MIAMFRISISFAFCLHGQPLSINSSRGLPDPVGAAIACF
jgi:hypothetical protein